MIFAFLYVLPRYEPLDGALNLAGAQATGAYMHLFRGAGHHHANLLNVGRPNAAARTVGVADSVAAHHTLFANLTIFSHI